VQGAFETNPDQNLMKINMMFETRGPSDVLTDGNIAFQWATYQKVGDYTTPPTSVACISRIGDPLDSVVQTFSGMNSMDSDSLTVKDRTYLANNVEERAPIDNSYKLKT